MTGVAGVILAGGLARRMGGGDKGRLRVGQDSLITRVIARLAPQVDGMAINANGDPTRFADLGLPVIADSIPDHPGPLAGVLAGLDWAAGSGISAIATAPADSPFFPQDLVVGLQAAAVGGLAIASDRTGQLHPAFGLWPVSLRNDLRAAITGGTRKILRWTDAHGAGTAVFPDEDAFFNVNTPEDLARAAEMAP